MKKTFLIAVLCTVFLAAMTLLLHSPGDESDAMQAAAMEVRKVTLHGAKTESTIYPSPAQIQVQASGGLAEELRFSPSFRAFVYRAIRNPEKGGYLYAQHVITVCRRALEKKDVVALNDAQRAAVMALIQRCDMTKEDLAQYDRELPELRDAERDPLLGLASDGFISAKSQEERNIASVRILASKEPLLLRIVQSVEVVKRGDGTFTSREYFGGKWYGEERSELMDVAWALANCELGGDCGPNAPSTLQLCIDKGLCGGTLQEAIQRGPSSAWTYDEAAALKSEIVSAVNRQDIRPFIGPEGNPLPFK